MVPLPQHAPAGLVIAPPDQIIEHAGFDMLRAELLEFARCIRDKRTYPVDIEDVLHGITVLDACVRSAETGAIVNIPAVEILFVSAGTA